MTAIDPGRPSTASAPSTASDRTAATQRLATVTVNLLPPEIALARRGHEVRRIAVAAVAVLALVLAGASVVVRSGVGAAQADLAAADTLSASLRAQQGRFSEVVTLQETVRSAQEQLDRLTAGSVDWAPLLAAVTAAVPRGVTVGAIDASTENSGTAGSAGGAPGGAGATGATGATGASGTAGAVGATAGGAAAGSAAAPATPVGTLGLTGEAADPGAVAAFVDALAAVPGLTAVVATGVAGLGDATAGVTGYSYGITAVLTTAAARPAATTVGGR